jgi:type IV secretion system protein VirB10
MRKSLPQLVCRSMISGLMPGTILLCVMFLPFPARVCAQSGLVANRPAGQAEAQPSDTITVPAGTRILVALKSPLHTTSAEPGTGIYSETASVVVQDGRVVIPLKAQVQGTVESSKRPGRVKGRAAFLLHFTSLTFPNNYTVAIDGALRSVPGSEKLRTKGEQGKIEPVDQIDRDIGTVFKPSLAGAALGSISSLGKGTFTGAGVGALFGLGKVLITRGDEIRLNQGATIEVVLQRPLILEQNRLNGTL